MKNRFTPISLSRLLLAICCLFLSIHANGSSYYGTTRHYASISFGGGYTHNLLWDKTSLMTNNTIGINTLGNGGAHIGINYEYQYNSFWLSLGAEAQLMTDTYFLTNLTDFQRNILDKE